MISKCIKVAEFLLLLEKYGEIARLVQEFQEIHLNEHLWMVGADPSTQQLETVQSCLYGGDFCILWGAYT